jgi:DNA-binding transcriptional LysR family regulator
MKEIETFLAVAEELHFGRAASRLHVTTSHVSQTIQRLERHVGAPLFERTSRRVGLTPLGTRLYHELRRAYDAVVAAIDHARAEARSQAGTLVIGATVTTSGPWQDRLITAFERLYPDCRTNVREVPLADPLTWLREGTIDVLITWLVLDEPDLTLGPVVARVSRVLLMSADHPLAAQNEVSAEVLAEHPVLNWQMQPNYPGAMLQAIVPTQTPSGRPVLLHPSPVSTLAEGLSHIARGLAVHPTAVSIAQQINRDDIVLRPITDLPPLPLGLTWHSAHENARIRAFAHLTRTLAVNRVPTT